MTHGRPKGRHQRTVVLLIAVFLLTVGVAAFAGLFLADGGQNQSEPPVSGEASAPSLVSDGQGAPPVVVESQPDPVPGERLPTLCRAIWLTGEDMTRLEDAYEALSSAKEKGFTSVVLEGVADLDGLNTWTEAADSLDLPIQLALTEEADPDLLLEGLGDTELAAFLVPVDGTDWTALRETVIHRDPATAFGLYTWGLPGETSLPEEMDLLCIGTDGTGTEELLGAWDDALVGSGTALFVCAQVDPEPLAADPMGLARLQNAAIQLPNYRGTLIRGAEALLSDTTGAADALYAAFRGEGSISPGAMSIAEPAERVYSTYKETFLLRGTADPLYPVVVNGEVVKPGEDGSFLWTCDLTAGENDICVTYMGEDTLFTVTRLIDVISSVSPSSTVDMDGGVYLSVSAKALSGAKVTAKLNGQTLTLEEEEALEEDKDDGYVTFSALYLLPDATQQVQNLGKVTFHGTYQGASESVTGGRVRVIALPTPTPTSTPTPTPTPTAEPTVEPTVEPTSTPTPTPTEELVKVVTVTASHLDGVNLTKTFNTAYRDDRSVPTRYFLATGMIDTLNREVNFTCDDGYIECYQLSAGTMIHQSDCTLTTREKIVNTISSAALSDEDGRTVIRFKGTEPVAVYPSLSPLSFTASHPLGYSVKSFSSSKVELLFSNTYVVQDILGFNGNKLFSSYTWTKVEDGQYKLTLTLKKAGGFYGIKMEIDEQGRVVLSFKNPVSLARDDNEYGYSLKGVTVVLDAGHNGNYPYNPGAAGFYDGLHECNLNLMLAEKTKAILEDLGAEVIMTRTNNASSMTDDQRVAKIIKADADVCIAIHHNGSSSSSAYGTSAYYYYPFSQKLSQAVYEHMVDLYQTHIYTEGEKKEGCAAGCRYYPYYMTRMQEYPSILVEAGYITNRTEYEFLIRDDIQDEIAKAFTAGIVDFLAAQS